MSLAQQFTRDLHHLHKLANQHNLAVTKDQIHRLIDMYHEQNRIQGPTPEEKARAKEIYAKYTAGYKVADLASRYGVNQSTIGRWLKDCGYQLRARGSGGINEMMKQRRMNQC